MGSCHSRSQDGHVWRWLWVWLASAQNQLISKASALWGKPGTERMPEKYKDMGRTVGVGKGSAREQRASHFLQYRCFPDGVFREDGSADAEQCSGCVIAPHAC